MQKIGRGMIADINVQLRMLPRFQKTPSAETHTLILQNIFKLLSIWAEIQDSIISPQFEIKTKIVLHLIILIDLFNNTFANYGE
jgi:hypothetical protein